MLITILSIQFVIETKDLSRKTLDGTQISFAKLSFWQQYITTFSC